MECEVGGEGDVITQDIQQETRRNDMRQRDVVGAGREGVGGKAGPPIKVMISCVREEVIVLPFRARPGTLHASFIHTFTYTHT